MILEFIQKYLLDIKGKPKLKEIREGDWDKGFELNFGIFIWPDGRKYKGYWKEDKQNGESDYFTTKRKWEDDSGKTD